MTTELERQYRFREGDRVQVSLPYGKESMTVHPATVIRISEHGPTVEHRNHKVRFDDELIFGGTGEAWVSPTVLAPESGVPAKPERDTA